MKKVSFGKKNTIYKKHKTHNLKYKSFYTKALSYKKKKTWPPCIKKEG